jgi:hypothetical protein
MRTPYPVQRACRKFVRNIKQDRRGKPTCLKPAALSPTELEKLELFEARLMLELTLLQEASQ